MKPRALWRHAPPLVTQVAPKPAMPLRAIPGTTAPGLAPEPIPVAAGQGRPDRRCLVCGAAVWYRVEGCAAWWCVACVPPTRTRLRIVERVEVV